MEIMQQLCAWVLSQL
ncbi:hypothetical protein FOXB_13210 [Fusarium oxysporum f. sp. conglutinans Fo5176]|uniref:Uncharacterized protein n=1 Tax=Fusarium oxysporum (strain Fo5176) TaxID=660025 RepID=F9G3H8_FUSOF|nr:hypothetical protein FOXB_13210 [Fusarium oxysporum f. sp. conglutinans Fo5176]